LEGQCGGECSVLLFVVGVIAAVLGGLVVGLFSGLIYVLSTVNKRSDNEFSEQQASEIFIRSAFSLNKGRYW
jgi:hypothetical protein